MLAAQARRFNQTDHASKMTALSEAPVPAIEKQLSHPKYRPDIDGLRAIAVLSVVAFHAFPSLIQGGFVGVDVFFVISGFLISSIIFGSLEKNSFSFVDFYCRRVNRIFPALLLMLAVTWSFGWFSLLADEYTQLGKYIAGGAAFVSNFVLLGEAGYFDNSAETKLLLHLWSLGIEEQFYLIWPLIVWAAWKARLNALILILLVGGTSFALNIMSVHADPVATFYSPQTRFWELLVGSFLAYIIMHKQQIFPAWRESTGPVVRNIQSLAGLTLLAAAFALTTKSNQFPGWWALLPTVGAALIISAGPFAWFNRTILSRRPLVWFGLISFPLYLWHWPLLTFQRILNNEPPSVLARGLAVAASILLAWITYRYVEKFIRRRTNPRKTAAILSLAMAGIAAAGLATLKLDGIPSRFPTEIKEIADFKYEFLKDARNPECWISITAPYNGFAPKCLDAGDSSGSERILIWGDSHAARLYPGLASVVDRRATLLQATRSSCPPILDFAGPVCTDSNNYVLSRLKDSHPSTVILFGAWGRYGVDWPTGSDAQKKLLHTIEAISEAGVKNIIVLGPSPEWTLPLPNLVFNAWKSDFIHRIPRRMSEGLNPTTKTIDDQFKEFIPQTKASLIPVYDALCDSDGCITYTGETLSNLTTWDYGHLTTEGAKVVAKKIIDSGLIQ
ncbi:acyltransferase family protein [Pseudomonas sp. GL-RE-26]|uniref:acyltransferase family protein n=1 Tax=Pseudomonas sp. GL-RE-26 TaxID=2832390 RepID=UPI001CC17E8B|nr:acyltransferase family protein [Pseudomonas sp. GL-RE-26]